jgi:hypothetical protein
VRQTKMLSMSSQEVLLVAMDPRSMDFDMKLLGFNSSLEHCTKTSKEETLFTEMQCG